MKKSGLLAAMSARLQTDGLNGEEGVRDGGSERSEFALPLPPTTPIKVICLSPNVQDFRM